MSLIAITNINHGTPGDDENIFIDAGDEVDENLFDEDTINHFKEIGAVAEGVSIEKYDELRAKVEELQAQLAAMQSEQANLDAVAAPTTITANTALDPLNGVPGHENPESDDNESTEDPSQEGDGGEGSSENEPENQSDLGF